MPIVAPEETCYTFSMEKKGALDALREKRCNMRHVLTSEAVTRGHPDKLCDQVADGVLDALLTEDPEARVACEAAVWENHLLLFGEISARQEPDYEVVAREVLRDIGYDRPGLGLNADHCDIQVLFHPQSPDIAQGVSHRSAEDTGAGDQGIMTGYACRETPELMPLPVTLAGALVKRLDHMRRSGGMPWLLPDGKAQVSVAYEDGRPARITTVVLSTQHTPNVRTDALRKVLRREVILPVLPPALLDEEPLLYINPTGPVRHRRPRRGQPASPGGKPCRTLMAAQPTMGVVLWQERTPQKWTAPGPIWPGIWRKTWWRQAWRTAARCSWPTPSALRTPSACR